MTKIETNIDWREARRQSARAAIVDAAWALVRDEGLAGLAIRDLASRAGITTPTVCRSRSNLCVALTLQHAQP
ncbi:MAG: TetR family transcriptional regulator [Acidobacteria bacterium]|nr:TetR family transcriptional regulator [Acidobacteriota bacterium]